LAKTPFGAAESTVLRNYIDTCLDIPWCIATEQTPTVAEARKVLDADHAGLEKVKKRILEYVAVKQISPDVKNQILCLVGPPGVGKTSVAISIARAMKRKYARISLGGVRDESDIRGHRKTYVGAMPGRIAEALTTAGVNNPVIILDEIDKLAKSLQGDPASALLEVLDPEQNKHFRDHFLELPMDLSDCLFIATANDFDGIPLPLIDRMEIITLSSYSRTEKFHIAKRHLLPKQLTRHGLSKRALKLTDDALFELIDFYTREAGVRNLEREIASLARKAAVHIADEGCKTVRITAKTVNEMLGKRKYLKEELEKTNPVGVVNGLAYTQSGGDLLKVEVAVMDGDGKVTLTGQLGEVMKESASLAISYIRTVANKLGIAPDFYKKKDIHIHFPEGAVPKDGPSAGVAMSCALASALSGAPTRRDVAMTGEITLRGHVLPIGGLKEKTMAAYASGITTVLLPAENEKDLDEIDAEVRDALQFVFCREIKDAFEVVLLDTNQSADKENNLSPIIPTVTDATVTQVFR
jgi:ATP-dependent Lon protease